MYCSGSVAMVMVLSAFFMSDEHGHVQSAVVVLQLLLSSEEAHTAENTQI